MVTPYFGRTNTDPITLPKILLKSRSEKKKDLIMLYNTSNKQNKTKKNKL